MTPQDLRATLEESAPAIARALGAEFVRIMEERERRLMAAVEGTESQQLLESIGETLLPWLKETAQDPKPNGSMRQALTVLAKQYLMAKKREEDEE